MKLTWCEAVIKYLKLVSEKENTDIITRKTLCNYLPQIKDDVKYLGKTPDQTLSRTLQILRDMGCVTFLGRGKYKLLNFTFEYKPNFSKGEQTISKILNELNLEFETEKKFETLKYNSYLRLDFYFVNNKKKFAIEFDGVQHRRSVEYFGGKKSFEKRKKLDEIKNLWCKKNNINLLRCGKNDYSQLKFDILKFILQNVL